MAKRIIDVVGSSIGLLLFAPFLLLASFLVWIYDFDSPIYISKRVGINGVIFDMYKIRSMKNDSSLKHVVSTSNSDTRITYIGKIIRKYKIDELSQLVNVLLGSMSLVGPRPNVIREVELYSEIEKKILLVKPGITDISSIVFSDLNDILSDSDDPNLDYNQLVRPWKSRFCLFYIKNRSIKMDIHILLITALSIFSRQRALNYLHKLLLKFNATPELLTIAKREIVLVPHPPPGFTEFVTSR